jgi:hypothetical protein
MPTKKDCKNHEYQYYHNKTDHNGDNGWKCVNCSFVPPEPEQERLSHDMLAMKIYGITQDLFDDKWIYIPNGSTGEVIQINILNACIKAKRNDELFIAQCAFSDPNVDLHDELEKIKKK